MSASQYYKVTARVGVPHRNSVEVTIPLVGPVGPAGPQGPQGLPGEVSGSIAWDNVTDKPSTFPPSTHTHVAADVTDFAAAVAAVSPPVDWNSLTGKPATFAPSAHTHPISEITNLQTALDGKAATSHTHTASQVTDFNAAAAAAAPVQSVNGNTGAVTVSVPTASSATPQALGVSAAGTSSDFARADHVHAMPSAADVGAAPATGIDPTAISGTAVVDSDARLSDSRTPSSHASSHASAGSDPVSIDATQVSGLALVALSNSYAELDDLPFIPAIPSDIGAAAASHTHAASDITSGTLDIARIPTGTSSTQVALGDHTHTQLHDKSHAMTDATSHTAGNHKVFYSNGSGEIVELALGNSGEVLTSNGATSAPSFAAKPVELVIACSDETTDLTTGTAKVTFRAPYAFLLTGVRASVNTAPTGSTLIVDINNGANSALSTKLSIDASEKTSTTAATAAVIDTTYDDFSDDAEITIDIDQIGSTIAGKGLKVTLIGTRA